ncbi:hypothetical protein CRE_17607 [Caenorhabditis remanei]|uniref:Uncharacterized protein n=1 Tax=Caenorhabditis remanei TaxID=31234 RepID=E3NHA4_CAERE|nr:hypothetical protein CRE_17607 [Caenorhabditis remanei]
MHRLVVNTENEETKQMAEVEMRRFEKKATEYISAVENRLAMIQYKQFDNAEEIPELPEFPVFSQEFRSIFENIMKSREKSARVVPVFSLMKSPQSLK